MLRIRTYLGPMITLEMRSQDADERAIKVYREIKASKVRGKTMKFHTHTGEVEVEIDNIKYIESIKPSTISTY